MTRGNSDGVRPQPSRYSEDILIPEAQRAPGDHAAGWAAIKFLEI